MLRAFRGDLVALGRMLLRPGREYVRLPLKLPH
jgi:hypothetical protein